MAKFKVGDLVTVVKPQCKTVIYWYSSMDEYVGKVFEITSVGDNSVTLAGCKFFMPIESIIVAGPYAKYHFIAREICGASK